MYEKFTQPENDALLEELKGAAGGAHMAAVTKQLDVMNNAFKVELGHVMMLQHQVEKLKTARDELRTEVLDLQQGYATLSEELCDAQNGWSLAEAEMEERNASYGRWSACEQLLGGSPPPSPAAVVVRRPRVARCVAELSLEGMAAAVCRNESEKQLLRDSAALDAAMAAEAGGGRRAKRACRK